MAQHGRGIVFRPVVAGPRPAEAGGATTITPPTGALTVTGPTLSLLSTIAIGVGALTIASAAPALAHSIQIPSAALTVSGPAPTLQTSGGLTVPTGSLTIEGQYFAIAGGGPATGTLTLTGQTPSVVVSSGETIAVPVGALTLTGQSPSLGTRVSLPTGALTVTGSAVTLARTIPVPVGGLTVTGQTALASANSNSLQFYGEGNSATDDKVYIVCNPSDAINVGQTDFTIEFFCRMPTDLQAGTATAGANYSWINSPIIVDRDLIGSVGSGGDWGISATTGRITFGIENSAASQRTIIGTTDLRDDRRHHVAVTRQRSSGDLAVYVDGVREAVFAAGPSGDVHVASDSATDTWNRYYALGGEKHALDWPQGQWRGWLDELRISTTLRYTGTSYTIPSADFVPDANTVGLYHFNENTGTTLLDFSGNVNHGDINVRGTGSQGPTWQTDGWQEWATPGYSPATAALVLSGPAPRIALGLALPMGSLTFTGHAPTLASGGATTITMPTGALTLTGHVVSLGTQISLSSGALVVTGVAPALAGSVAVPTGALLFTGQAPAVVGTGGIVPSTGALVLTGQVPTLSGTVPISVPTGSLVLTGTAPTVARAIIPLTGSLTLTGQLPSLSGTVRIDPLTGALALTGQAPALLGSGAILVPVGALLFSGQAPIITGTTAIAPGSGALTVTGHIPALRTQIALPSGALVLTGQPLERLGTGAILLPTSTMIVTGQTPGVVTNLLLIFGEDVIIRVRPDATDIVVRGDTDTIQVES